jgi:hypothetical protein
MSRHRSATLQFNAIRFVAGLLLASLIEQIARQEAPGQKTSDDGLPQNLQIKVAVDQAWSRARVLWQEAKELSSRGGGNTLAGVVQLPPAAGGVRRGRSRQLSTAPDRRGTGPDQSSGLWVQGKVPLVLMPVESGLPDQGSKAYGQDVRGALKSGKT